ncbi:integrase, catalytic region, zinc finger, CCHC-type containing protein [Tanacetum coccineum]
MNVYIAELRRSGRFRGQRPVVEENTIDEAINVHEEDSDDDFVPTSYPSKQAIGSNTTPVKWTKRLIVARSPDVQTVVKESEISKGKKRAANDKKMNRPKKRKVSYLLLSPVFIPVSNDGHEFLVVFNLKTPYVCVLDSKKGEKVETKKSTKHVKKVSSIANDSLASGHNKTSDIFTVGLKHLKMKCQTNSKAANCGVFVMRHMETYMGNTNEKFECGLDRLTN